VVTALEITMAIAPNSTWLATASDRTVRIWDLATGQRRATLTGHTGLVIEMAIAPNSTWLAAVSDDDGAVRIWDPATGNVSTIMRVDCPLAACAWSPSGRYLVAAGHAGLYCFSFNY
jgi:WD40 repeat protein